jgi:hypothetical protein
MVSERISQQVFFGVAALLFAASAALTIAWCASMSAMGEMPMPGGWTMSMAWMRMPGQTWPGACTRSIDFVHTFTSSRCFCNANSQSFSFQFERRLKCDDSLLWQLLSCLHFLFCQ